MLTSEPKKNLKINRLNLVLTIFALLVATTWLIATPQGLDGKLHAVGYSVCHQLDEHSYAIGGKVLPLCARCTGTFIGLFLSLVYLCSQGKRSGFPSKPKIFVLVLFFLYFAVDGINSTLSFIPGLTSLYPSANLLRLTSGLLMGISLATLVMTLWNQTLWVEADPAPLLAKWKQLGFMVVLCAAAGAVTIANIPILYYPVAILSITGIVLVLSMIYALLWSIILKKENSMHLFKDGYRIFIVGIMTAMLQIGVMDLLRYSLSGNW